MSNNFEKIKWNILFDLWYSPIAGDGASPTAPRCTPTACQEEGGEVNCTMISTLPAICRGSPTPTPPTTPSTTGTRSVKSPLSVSLRLLSYVRIWSSLSPSLNCVEGLVVSRWINGEEGRTGRHCSVQKDQQNIINFNIKLIYIHYSVTINCVQSIHHRLILLINIK